MVAAYSLVVGRSSFYLCPVGLADVLDLAAISLVHVVPDLAGLWDSPGDPAVEGVLCGLAWPSAAEEGCAMLVVGHLGHCAVLHLQPARYFLEPASSLRV